MGFRVYGSEVLVGFTVRRFWVSRLCCVSSRVQGYLIQSLKLKSSINLVSNFSFDIYTQSSVRGRTGMLYRVIPVSYGVC